jgi:hypothetical protein
MSRFMSLVLMVGLALVRPLPVGAQASDDAAIKSYALEIGKVKSFLTASEAFMAAKKADPALAAELEAMGDESTDTLAQARASLKNHPRVMGFFQKAGLSVDDAILIPRALLAAAVAAEFPAAASASSPAQISFIKQYPDVSARLKKLNANED